MLLRLLWLIVVAASCAWPSVAHACSCFEIPADLPTTLRTARAEATAIYRARISSVAPSGPDGKASAKVLEVFKGQLEPGATLEVPSGGGGDCTIRFKAGLEYLMYAHGEEPDSVGACSRTRPVATGDSELVWLRTGQLPPVPVAIQHQSVSCEPCAAEAVGGRLIAAPGAAPGSWQWPPRAETDMKEGRPFLTRSDSASDKAHHVMVGMSFDGKPFELAQTPHHAAEGTCMQQVQLRWCKRLDVSTPAPGAYPRFTCVEPGEASLQCDETRSREASWGALEVLSPKQCDWRSPSEPKCARNPKAPPLAKGAPRSPLLVCHPQAGLRGNEVQDCRVEVNPKPTDKAR